MSSDERIAILETTIHHTDASLTGIMQEIRRLSDRMDQRFLELDRKIDSNFKWVLGIMLGGFASTLGVVAHAMHWL